MVIETENQGSSQSVALDHSATLPGFGVETPTYFKTYNVDYRTNVFLNLG